MAEPNVATGVVCVGTLVRKDESTIKWLIEKVQELIHVEYRQDNPQTIQR